MRLRVKSNGKEVSLSKELYDQLPISQKRAYEIISQEGTEKNQPVKSEVKVKSPETGQKK